MKGVRDTGLVVSLAVLAFFVCSVAIQRQFDRSSRSSLQWADGRDGFTHEVNLLTPPSDFSDLFPLEQPSESCSTRPGCDVISAHQLQDSEERNETIRTSDPPTTVPVPVDAVPVDVAGSDTSFRAESESENENESVRKVIERELSHTSSEERDIWFHELKSLPAGVVRDLLQVRKQLRALPRLMGGLPEKLASAVPPTSLRANEVPAQTISQKIRFDASPESKVTMSIRSAISQLQHNLTNARTPGFKRLRVSLIDCYRPTLADDDDDLEDSPLISHHLARVEGLGCQLAPVLLDLKQGVLKNTERQLDLAINGEGFFVVRRGETEFLTRCGAFTLNSDRQLCLVFADEPTILQPVITIPDDVREVQVSADGTVTILSSSESTLTTIGRLQLARVASPARLQPTGQTLYQVNDQSGPMILDSPMANGLGELQQGFLEQSNVEMQAEVEEIDELQAILKMLPVPQSRSMTASGPNADPLTR